MKSSEKITWFNNGDAYTVEQRRSWYSKVADAYNRARPRYPMQLVSRVVELAELDKEAIILEVGCGPGTATTSFAQLGFSMICVEPSLEACELARQNCAQYPKVEVKNTTFEEWELEPAKFNAVLSATAFHWIPAEIGYPKAADALQDNGSLILMLNMQVQPDYEVYQVLHQVYQIHAPSLGQYETREIQEKNFRSFGKFAIDSGRFQNLVSQELLCEVSYSVDDYLTLLSTYSPYIALEPQKRDSLFAGLREALEKKCGGSVEVSFLSGFHIARKI
ncbi:class I SAM-dependent methyltransferase [Hassallia byssoidea VB512170]|uniref:Class I SAM-dependent methyltransferase n=1 Tax=Hassallia byssoidea VB512170 TaxID=1304833 RepID=A0A846H4K1_9CYAN|nr:class I SAM-dependent methyltransferase [Hassalia byssoidea]NEU71564.1 class I SAM-dependent methyltransferase [Hassalia byssoidea VB512170]